MLTVRLTTIVVDDDGGKGGKGATPKRPHQAFLSVRDAATGLEVAYPFAVRESGKATLELVSMLVTVPMPKPMPMPIPLVGGALHCFVFAF